jgi:hypothetical protein
VEIESESIDARAYHSEIDALCRVKAEEFAAIGYERISPRDIRACAEWMTRSNQRLYALVETVLTMRIDQFMNYQTVNAYKGIFSEDEPLPD